MKILAQAELSIIIEDFPYFALHVDESPTWAEMRWD